LENSESVVKKLVEQSGLSWISAQFYRKAIEQLLQCRTTLQLSYIFGYFRPLKKATQRINKLIFENLQLDLERHTEKLSDLLERGNALDMNQSNPMNLGFNVGMGGSTTKKGSHSKSKTNENTAVQSSSSSSTTSPIANSVETLLEKQEAIINQTRVAFTVRQALINAAGTEVYSSTNTATTSTSTTVSTTQKTGKRAASESKKRGEYQNAKTRKRRKEGTN